MNGGPSVAEESTNDVAAKTRFDFLFKIVLCGDSNTGKSSLISRYVDDVFNENTLTTIGVDFKLKTIEVDGYKVKLQLWDTAGQERYAPIGEMYYRGAHAHLIAYDITNSSSFSSIPSWLNKISNVSKDDKRMIVFVGCKSDLESDRQVEKDTGQRIAIQNGARWTEVSSRTCKGVEELFNMIGSNLVHMKTDYLHKASDMSSRKSGCEGVECVRERSVGHSNNRLSRISISKKLSRLRKSMRRSVIRGDNLDETNGANQHQTTPLNCCITR